MMSRPSGYQQMREDDMIPRAHVRGVKTDRPALEAVQLNATTYRDHVHRRHEDPPGQFRIHKRKDDA